MSHNRTSAFRQFVLASGGLTALAFALPAQASDLADDTAAAVDVAAEEEDRSSSPQSPRRRDENVQDVPIAVEGVVSATCCWSGGATTRLARYSSRCPACRFSASSPRNTNINIRGLGSNVALTNDGLENGVGFYIDNVYYGRVGLSSSIWWISKTWKCCAARSTLFGKNTTSGVINITSRKPSFAQVSAISVGNYGYYQVRASASAGIVPDLIAASATH